MTVEVVSYVSKTPGLGSCFHQSLATWQNLSVTELGWRVAVGIMMKNAYSGRHVHAWLECNDIALSAMTGQQWRRIVYYTANDIEPQSVRLINPRRILRRYKINRDAVTALLNAWDHPWQVVNGGVIPID